MPGMNIHKTIGFCCTTALLCVFTGCGGKDSVTTTELEAAFAADSAPPPAEAEGDREGTDSPEAIPAGELFSPEDLRQHVQTAVQAIQKDEYLEAAFLLQTLRSTPSLNADQLTAVQDTMASLQSRLAILADRGDSRARQALEAIARMPRQ